MDTISDFLTKIRNALQRKKPEMQAHYSKINLAIAKILKQQGYIEEIKKTKLNNKESIILKLEYDEQGNPVISHIQRLSSPGQRLYTTFKQIPKVKPLAGHKQQLGIVIISTSQGIMTGQEARKRHLGGELIAEIY